MQLIPVSVRSTHWYKVHTKSFKPCCDLSGEIGNWKTQFSVADNELFDSVLEKWVTGKEIPFKYT